MNCNCLALYDWNLDFSIAKWVNLSIEWFEELSLPITHLVYSNLTVDAREVKVEGDLSQIERMIKSEHLLDLSLYSIGDRSKGLSFEWTAVASLRTKRTKIVTYCLKSESLDLEKGLPGIAEIVRMCGVVYGIGYSMNYDLGPYFYSMGISVDRSGKGADEGIVDQVGKWFREMMGAKRYLSEVVRDVYPVNIVSEKHLNKRIGFTTLKQLIISKGGTLVKLDHGVWLWRIDVQTVPSLRKRLCSAKMVISV